MEKATTLSARTAEAAKPGDKSYRIHDAKVSGLHLRVQPSGLKIFCLVWARNRTLTLGRYPVMTLEAARQSAIAKLNEAIENGAPLTVTRKRADTFGSFIDDNYAPWMEAERKTGVRTIAVIRKEFADLLQKPIGEVTAFAIEKYKAARLKAGINPATVNRDVVRIKAAMAKAVEWKVIAENPLRSVKRAKGENHSRVRFLSKEKALRDALERREEKYRQRRDSGNAWRAERGRDALPAIIGYCDHITPMTLVALNTGLRRGELTSITWANVNLPGKLVTVQAAFSKSSKARHVPLNSEAVDVLRSLRKQQKGEGRLFLIACPKKAWNALTAAAKNRHANRGACCC